jgi:peptidoglycan/xylan/chitin deacetylase (PgdA/CDA1 family)
LFQAVGGFDTRFTVGGSFGNEDIDFGYRLMTAGYSIVFCSTAVSHQRYVVSPAQHLRQWRQAGRADVAFARKHPQEATTLFELNGASSRLARRIARPLSKAPLWQIWTAPLCWLAVALASLNLQDRCTVALFQIMRALEYWRGVWEAGGIPTYATLRVLAYHAIADLSGSPSLEAYGTPCDVFRRQITLLHFLGFRFVHPDELVALLQGRGGLPRKACLLTFDDGYQDFVEAADILRERQVPAVVFAVSGYLGGTNEWDRGIGAPVLRLLDAQQLRELQAGGIEIGTHTSSHRALTTLASPEIAAEVSGSISELESAGIRRPRFLAYPFGEHNELAETAVAAAGLVGAFTVEKGIVHEGTHPARLPRLEILRSDRGWRFVAKMLLAR